METMKNHTKSIIFWSVVPPPSPEGELMETQNEKLRGKQVAYTPPAFA